MRKRQICKKDHQGIGTEKILTSALPLNEAVNKENAEGPTIWKGNQVGAILMIRFRHLFSDIVLGFPFAFMGVGGGLPVLGSYVFFRVT